MSTAKKLEEQKYTFEEYLELEEKAEYKNEFWDGEIVAMAGATPAHNKITSSLIAALDQAIDKKGKDCSIYNSDQKIYLPTDNKVVYPDCMVMCKEEEYHDKSEIIITNPSLIIEVLSKSTQNYDKGAKFESYRSIPSFKEYVLVWQSIPKVQSWYKQEENLWRISSVFGLDKSITLYSIDCEITLKDIYKRVKNLGDQEIPNAY